MYRYGHLLSIDTKISINHQCMTSLWRHNVSTPSKIEKLSFCVKNIGKNWFSVENRKTWDFFVKMLKNYDSSAYHFKYFQNNPILKSRKCTTPPRQLWELTLPPGKVVGSVFCCLFLFVFVLFCFVLFCFVLFCFVLFCFVLFCFVFLFFVKTRRKDELMQPSKTTLNLPSSSLHLCSPLKEIRRVKIHHQFTSFPK